MRTQSPTLTPLIPLTPTPPPTVPTPLSPPRNLKGCLYVFVCCKLSHLCVANWANIWPFGVLQIEPSLCCKLSLLPPAGMFDWCDDSSHQYFQISKLGFINDVKISIMAELILQWSSVEEYLLATFFLLVLDFNTAVTYLCPRHSVAEQRQKKTPWIHKQAGCVDPWWCGQKPPGPWGRRTGMRNIFDTSQFYSNIYGFTIYTLDIQNHKDMHCCIININHALGGSTMFMLCFPAWIIKCCPPTMKPQDDQLYQASAKSIWLLEYQSRWDNSPVLVDCKPVLKHPGVNVSRLKGKQVLRYQKLTTW